MHLFDGQLLDVPLIAGPQSRMRDRLAAMRQSLLPALLAAHAAGRDISVGWLRPTAGARLRVLLKGWPVTEGRVAYPAGARGVPADAEDLAAVAEFPVWTSCAVRHDALSVEPEPSGSAEIGGVLEDLVEALGDVPFCWLVRAAPVRRSEIRDILQDLDLDLAYSHGRETLSGEHALAAERQRARYRELAQQAGGLWRVRVGVGTADAASAATVAGMLSATADLSATGYLLDPDVESTSFAEVPDTGSDGLASGALLGAIARPPVRELAGIRVVEQARFDLTPEGSGDIELGQVIDGAGQRFGAMTVSRETLNRHTFVAGATGAGKSQTIRHLLEQLTAGGVPWLVVEPAKAEYAGMAGRLGEGGAVAVVRPGDPDAIPLSVNPLEPASGFLLQTHIDLVRALFLASFEAAEPFPQVLAQALTRCYAEAGWDLATGDPLHSGVSYPTLGDLQACARQVVDEIGYGPELAPDVRGFIDVRLGSMRLGSAGGFLDGGYPLDIGDLLARNVVLELEGIGDDQDKAFCMGLVLVRIIEHLRVRHAAGRSAGLRHVIVLEEAHRLLKASAANTPAAHAVELFASLLAEIRAYGEGVIVAEQIPSKIVPDVVKNTALKIMARLPAADDRAVVGAAMNLDEAQSRAVVSLPAGRAAVFADGMDRPTLIEVPLGEDREGRVAATGSVAIVGAVADPCTLREMSQARRLAECPELVLWIELLTVAHLTGMNRPAPSDRVFALVGGLGSPLVRHAVAELIRSAVRDRRSLFGVEDDYEALTAHVEDVAVTMLAGGGGCRARDEAGWTLGPFGVAAGRFRADSVPRQARVPSRAVVWGSDNSAVQRAIDALGGSPENLKTALPRAVGDPEQVAGYLSAVLD